MPPSVTGRSDARPHLAASRRPRSRDCARDQCEGEACGPGHVARTSKARYGGVGEPLVERRVLPLAYAGRLAGAHVMVWGGFRSTLSKSVVVDGWRGGWIRYAFLEGGEPIDPDRLIGPSGFPVQRPPLPGCAHRFRFSTIGVSDFERHRGQVDRIDDNPDRAARNRRRRQLQEAFGDVPMPVIDVYAPPLTDLIDALQASPSGWYFMVARPGEPDGDELLAIIGDAEAGEEDVVARLQLLGPAFEQARLREIFSLAHVADVGDDDEDGGGEPEPLPDPPPGAPVLVVEQLAAHWQGEAVTELEIEEVAEPTWEGARPQRQMIRLTE